MPLAEWTMMVPDNVAAFRILIVDDYADGAESMAMLLRMHGYHVEVVGDGPRALERERDYQPHVVLLDLGLPGMDGYEVARHFARQRLYRPPFLIAVTGYGHEDARRRSLEAGINLHLLKPVDAVKVRGILERLRTAIAE
jgi:CheY-like chemotaxis protein